MVNIFYSVKLCEGMGCLNLHPTRNRIARAVFIHSHA